MTAWNLAEAAIAAQEKALVGLRRTLHANPELSHREHATTAMLGAHLRELGYDVRVRSEGVGLYADLAPPGFDPATGRTVAVRADIDALPIQEQTAHPFASRNAGVMHACGHDIHSACVFGVAAGLAAAGPLPGRVRLIFQHAEEAATGGANEMVAFGALEGVEAIFGLHCDPERPFGEVGLRVGALTAAIDAFDIAIRGTGGHTARPHQAIDPLFVGVQVAQALYNFTGRAFDARSAVVLAIGAFEAGHTPNVIPHTARLQGTVRTLDPQIRAQLEPRMRQIVEGLCAAYGATFDFHLHYGAPAVINEPRAVAALQRAAQAIVGAAQVKDIPLPSMGAEDFSHYLEHVPGAMFRLGTAHGQPPGHLLHTPCFDPDERAIGLGARILTRAALEVLERGLGGEASGA